MKIILNITEDSNVEIVKDTCEAVQGENNVTILEINWPSTIKGYSIDNYTKQIEFGECKELGECVKFFDKVEGNTYKLCDICTQFEKILIQFKLTNLVDEAEPIKWKTKPFALEFCKSINAENTKQAQVVLLSLAEIEKAWATDLNATKNAWEEFVKANALRIIYKVGDVPTADATSLGDTIFYLGANSTSPYTLTYGHYYRCNYVNDNYEWTDLTQDPSIEGVANGIREISKNQTMQLWVDTKEKLKNEVIQPNTIYIPEDHDMTETFEEILSEMASKNNGVLKIGDIVIPQKKPLWQGEVSATGVDYVHITLAESLNIGDRVYIEWYTNGEGLTLSKLFVTGIYCEGGEIRFTPLASSNTDFGFIAPRIFVRGDKLNDLTFNAYIYTTNGLEARQLLRVYSVWKIIE